MYVLVHIDCDEVTEVMTYEKELDASQGMYEATEKLRQAIGVNREEFELYTQLTPEPFGKRYPLSADTEVELTHHTVKVWDSQCEVQAERWQILQNQAKPSGYVGTLE